MTTALPPFQGSSELSLGIELELQLVDLHHYNLTMEAADLLRRLKNSLIYHSIKPEITQSMIEVNSDIHLNYHSLLVEIQLIQASLISVCSKMNIGICGGGTHAFQKWKMQRIFPSERFANISEQYGFLAKQFTVFGQHIHIGCPNGDDALYLCHAFARYIPHFIALSASSPFQLSVDTSFDCSRLTAISAFPLSGTPPWLLTWSEFLNYYNELSTLGVVNSMKDFYWDIRPKPEFGTVELRICDTPLTVQKAAELAAFAQTLAAYLLHERPPLSRAIYLTYLVNRFRSARYGLHAEYIDPIKQQTFPLADDIIRTCETLQPYAEGLQSVSALESIVRYSKTRRNDATWLREQYTGPESLDDVVRNQCQLWMDSDAHTF